MNTVFTLESISSFEIKIYLLVPEDKFGLNRFPAEFDGVRFF